MTSKDADNQESPLGLIGLEMRAELGRFSDEVLQPLLSQLEASLRQDMRQQFVSRIDAARPLQRNRRPSVESMASAPQKQHGVVVEPMPLHLDKVGDAGSPGGQAVGRRRGIGANGRPGKPRHPPASLYLRGVTWEAFDSESSSSHIEVEDASTPMSRLSVSRRRSVTTLGMMLGTEDERQPTRDSIAFEKVSSVLPKRFSCERIVSNKWFERIVAVVILLNAMYIGATTQYIAIYELIDDPWQFQVTEGVFLFLFTMELLMRIWVYRCDLFRIRMPDGQRNEQVYWNILDTIIITIQIVESILMFLDFSSTTNFKGLTVVRILRLLRLVRILRIIKVTRLVADLRMIIYSIWRSLSLFFWSLIALFLLNFIVAVYFTEFILTNKISGEIKNEAEVNRYFGSLVTTMIVLFQAVTGGVDWGTVTDVLSRNTSEWAILPFFFYVLFNQIAMLNVISGVFLDTAMDIAKAEKDIYVVRNARHVFAAVDTAKTGTITWDDFENAITHPRMRKFFEAVDIRPGEARTLFDLLDTSGDGEISADEFLNGCLRVRGQSKALDLLILSREVAQLFEKQQVFEWGLAERHGFTGGRMLNGFGGNANWSVKDGHGPLNTTPACESQDLDFLAAAVAEGRTSTGHGTHSHNLGSATSSQNGGAFYRRPASGPDPHGGPPQTAADAESVRQLVAGGLELIESRLNSLEGGLQHQLQDLGRKVNFASQQAQQAVDRGLEAAESTAVMKQDLRMESHELRRSLEMRLQSIEEQNAAAARERAARAAAKERERAAERQSPKAAEPSSSSGRGPDSQWEETDRGRPSASASSSASPRAMAPAQSGRDSPREFSRLSSGGNEDAPQPVRPTEPLWATPAMSRSRDPPGPDWKSVQPHMCIARSITRSPSPMGSSLADLGQQAYQAVRGLTSSAVDPASLRRTESNVSDSGRRQVALY